MEAVLHMSKAVFIAVEVIVVGGLGFTTAMLLVIFFKELKNRTLW
jgi:hypothetical protein